MSEMKLGVVESRFADIIWENEPLTTKELTVICERELNWKRTTTYTVLKKLCNRGIFNTTDSIITSLISRDEFYATQSEQFVQKNFQGSLPAFIAAFTSRKALSKDDLSEIKELLRSFEDQKK
ncbi:MAG: BlaI/MecI/CopY family transcriptional regulator [Oscillospiraceae bacterium]|nr:BlaI/MecI/CopY family transcriptional regulator [Oscillospiraceae bacterium]